MPSQLPSGSASQTIRKLDFQEKLLQPGKRDTTEALLKRLKTLHTSLSSLEQDLTDVRSLDPVRKPLIHQQILHHKDRGVKIYAACCLADLLRLYAPDAPYTGEELRDIFQFILVQLTTNLKTSVLPKPLQPSRSKTNEIVPSQNASQTQASQRITEIAYYNEYVYLLESLATVKSIVLACDVPGGDELVTGFFTGFVEIVRSDMSKVIIRHMVSILVAVFEEAGSIPSGVMDAIVEQFSKYATRPETPSFSLTVDVCNRAADRLQRPIFAHFAEIQQKHGRQPDANDLTQMTESHDLLLGIYRNSPALLLNVIPVLEENLRVADEIPLRQLTTRTLGRMFGERPVVGTGVADIARAFPGAWRAWLGRKVDKSVGVRLAWVESAKGILMNHLELRKEFEREMHDRITDSDEKVRAAICKVIGSLDYETALHHVSVSTLQAVGGRLGDKKSAVRAEAAAALGRLWSAAYQGIETGDKSAIEQYAWIPKTMLNSLFKKDATLELRTQISATIKQFILPLPLKTEIDEDAWVDRLFLVVSHLDDTAFKALERLTGLTGYAKGSSPYRAFIDFCEANNGGIIDGDEKLIKARLNFIIGVMANQLFVDSNKAEKDMGTFAAANEGRLYKLFKSCVDPVSDLRTLVKARNELLRRIEQSHTDILETFTTLLDYAMFTIVNASSISALLRIMQRPGSGASGEKKAAAAGNLISLMAKECAPMFSKHVPELVIALSDKREKLVEVALQALAAVAKFDSDAAPSERKTYEKAIMIVQKGTPRQAKFAARFIAYGKHKDQCSDLVETILDGLSEKQEGRLLSYLRALSEFAISAKDAFEDKSDEIGRFIDQEVLLKVSPSAEAEDEEWVEEDQLEILDRAKLLAMRIHTHRAIGFARSDKALEIVAPVFEMLRSVLQNEGAVNQGTQEGSQARPHLRLRAVQCLLKLANVRVFDKNMGDFYEPVSLIAQDPYWTVRNKILLKLGEILPTQRLLPRWNIMPAMIANDPEEDQLALGKTILNSVVRACSSFTVDERIERIELPLARLLVVLTHHPDFDQEDFEWDLQRTKDMAKYIELYLDSVANRDNIGLLYHVAGKVKSVQDVKYIEDVSKLSAEEQAEYARTITEKNTNLWKLSELAQIIIKNRSEARGWNVTTYPGKIKLPKDLFHNLKTHADVFEVTRKTFLTEEEISWARGLGRKAVASAGPSRRVAEGGSSPVKKRSRAPKTGSRKRIKKSVADTSDEDDENESDGESRATAAEEDEEEQEVENGDGVVGRGGRRGAKTKAKRGIKVKKVEKVKEATTPSDETESDLTEIEE